MPEKVAGCLGWRIFLAMTADHHQINPKKLRLSKWTAVNPQNKEKHFLVTKVINPELPANRRWIAKKCWSTSTQENNTHQDRTVFEDDGGVLRPGLGRMKVGIGGAEGREIPWNQVSRINQSEMKTLITGIVDRIHTFLSRTFLCSFSDQDFNRALEKSALPWTKNWDEPKYLPDFLMPVKMEDRK